MASAMTSSDAVWPREKVVSGPLDVAIPERTCAGSVASGTQSDDLSRDVYCILGMPIDAIEMPAVVRSIEVAAANAAPFVISTPNLNFLVQSLVDTKFRESLLLSDLCPTDGIPIVWIAQLLGIPIKRRVAGSDIFEALKLRPRSDPPIKIFLFGSTEDVAEAAAGSLNKKLTGLTCVGWACPGFGNFDELSRAHFIDKINASGADFLVASLGAKNGQLWLQQNHGRLRIPIRAHLGATINFQAGTVKRAPPAMQKFCLEWLWRIKEEPNLWRRYWNDGAVLLRVLLTTVLPLAVEAKWQRLKHARNPGDLGIKQINTGEFVTLRLYGSATAQHVDQAVSIFREAVKVKKAIVIDLSETRAIDARFFGLLLMLRKQLKGQGARLTFSGASSRLTRMFRRSGVNFLLSLDRGA